MKERDEFEDFIQQNMSGKETEPPHCIWNSIEPELDSHSNGFRRYPFVLIIMAFFSIIALWSVNFIKGNTIFGAEKSMADLKIVDSRASSFQLYTSLRHARNQARKNRSHMFSFWVKNEEEQESLIQTILDFFDTSSGLYREFSGKTIWSVGIIDKDITSEVMDKGFHFDILNHDETLIRSGQFKQTEKPDNYFFNSILDILITSEKEKISKGEKLFSENCSNCHSSDLITPDIGPALGPITNGLDKKSLYDAGRNCLASQKKHEENILDLNTEEFESIHCFVKNKYMNISPKDNPSPGPSGSTYRVNDGEGNSVSGDDIFEIDISGPIDSLLPDGKHFRDKLEPEFQKEY